jgi:hypothetical protein
MRDWLVTWYRLQPPLNSPLCAFGNDRAVVGYDRHRGNAEVDPCV